MHDQRTPTTLLDGQIWVGWGPQVERPLARSEAVVELLMRQTGRTESFVASTIEHSQDLGRYLLTERLSITGHAAVYKGVDRSLAREVAVKIHRDRRRHDAEREIYQSQSRPTLAEPVRAGLDESRTMSRLSHPNIVQIHDMGEHGSWLYSVMELCDETLSEWCRGRDWSQIIDRFIEAGNGLTCLHEAGYAHGDVKGKNILIKSGVAKLADFGFAVRPNVYGNRPCGTAGFIAPEVGPRGPGFAGDVFALAVAIWVALFGELPFPLPTGEAADSKTVVAVPIQLALERKIEPPQVVPAGLPRSVQPLLEGALHPDPRKRPSLGELLEALRAARVGHDKRLQRRRAVLLGVAGVVIALGVGFSIGAARHGGSGEGSVVDVGLGELDPLTRAEIGARSGDGEVVREELNRAYSDASEASFDELRRISQRIEGIVRTLEETSPSDAPTVQLYLDGFRALESRASSPTRGSRQNK